MNTHEALRLKGTAVKFATGIVLLTALVVSTPAQRPSRRSSRPDPATTIRNRTAEMIRRETILGELKKQPAKAGNTREKTAAIEQIREDYVRLQVLGNEMMGVTFSDGALDYERLTDQAAEINKRANRLRYYLALPETGDDKKKPEYTPANDVETFKKFVVNLNQRIRSFIASPFFKNPGILDAQTSMAASLNLDSIISTSKFVGKNAASLRRKQK